eukprot:gene56802-biopygen38262
MCTPMVGPSDTAAARCCNDAGTECESDLGANSDCHREVSYDKAMNECANHGNGWRLCTRGELDSRLCCGTANLTTRIAAALPGHTTIRDDLPQTGMLGGHATLAHTDIRSGYTAGGGDGKREGRREGRKANGAAWTVGQRGTECVEQNAYQWPGNLGRGQREEQNMTGGQDAREGLYRTVALAGERSCKTGHSQPPFITTSELRPSHGSAAGERRERSIVDRREGVEKKGREAARATDGGVPSGAAAEGDTTHARC